MRAVGLRPQRWERYFLSLPFDTLPLVLDNVPHPTSTPTTPRGHQVHPFPAQENKTSTQHGHPKSPGFGF